VVEAHFRDEGDVVGGGKGLEALGGVVAGLGEPHAGVDTALKMLRALECDRGLRIFYGRILSGSDPREGHGEEEGSEAQAISHERSLILEEGG
jgi:hypothetical protein